MREIPQREMLGSDRRASRLVTRLLDVIEQDVVPLTREGVRQGNKVFGAAVLRKSDGALVAAGTNEESDCPLWHGEMAAIRNLYELPRGQRPPPAACVLLSSHEPCSMCLSAVAWAGFDGFFFLFPYERTRDAFQIPHDLRMLEELFGVAEGRYARRNAYWTGAGIEPIVETLPRGERERLQSRIRGIDRTYAELSRVYQTMKPRVDIPRP